MIFHSFQREDDDAVFTVVRNVSGAAFVSGDACVWDVGASVDGVRVTAAAAATLALFRGIVAESIADSAYGKVQIHGYFSTANVSNDTSNAIVAGSVLIASTDDTVLVYGAAGTGGLSGFVYAAEAYDSAATPAVADKKVLIRAM